MSMQAQPAIPPQPAPLPSTPDESGTTAGRRARVGAYGARCHTTLAAAAPLWRRLESEGTATAYQRLDWVGAVVDHLAGPMRAEPLVVEVVDEITGEPVLLVPLALVRHRGYSVLTWLDLGVCDYAVPLLAPGIDLTAAQMEEAWAAIRAVIPRVDLIRISRIPATVGGRPNPVAALAACRPMTMQASGVALEGDPATLIDRLCRPGVRKDLGKVRRRLERAGEVALVVASTPAEVDAIFDALVEQRRTRFAEMGRFNLLARPEVEAFYREGAHRGLAGGPVRLFGLSVNGEWIATIYTIAHAGTIYGLLVTMQGGTWRNMSPGLHTLAGALQWARAEGLDYFDFTVGVMPYKTDFGVQTRDLSELVEVASLRGYLVSRAQRSAEAAKTWLGTHPETYARLQKARRWLRRKAS